MNWSFRYNVILGIICNKAVCKTGIARTIKKVKNNIYESKGTISGPEDPAMSECYTTILLNRKLLLSKYYILKQADKAVFYSNLLAKTAIRAKFYDIFQIFHVFE